MNRNKLKTYAPEARRHFIEAVTARAAQYGLTAKQIEPMTVEGDVAIIAGKPYSKAVGEKRKKLEARINRDGFEQTMEAMAYTWFNRLVAIRFMELHEYLDHGYRVLSHPEGHNLPEIIEHAEHVDLPGLDKKKVIELKLDGTKEEELYRLLLIGQCNALSNAMPFLFESIDDETELLLPDHLLHSDSLIRNLVNGIPEDDWQEVEIIGWLYQFYISEKKDEVIGKVVKSDDIPAATQLFTPNWIVRYMLHNTLGSQWIATYPNSPLRDGWEYYIQPAEQTPEVEAKLTEITPASLNPEELTLLDPACGSGHILVEAYDMLKAIYQERGYRAKDIPRLILEKNLYGLEIDDRASQLAAFALLMKARVEDRNIFERGVQPNVLSIQESKELNATEIAEALNAPLPDGSTGDISQTSISRLIELFGSAKTVGAMVQVPDTLTATLPSIVERCQVVIGRGGMFERVAASSVASLARQALFLAGKYDAVVTNPPYLSGKFMNPELKRFIGDRYPDCSADVSGAFMKQCLSLTKPSHYTALVTPFHWMFISSFDDLRTSLSNNTTILSLVQLEYNAFEPACVPVCTFAFRNVPSCAYRGLFVDLSRFKGADTQAPRTLQAITADECDYRYTASWDDFGVLPRRQVAFSLGKQVLSLFGDTSVRDYSTSRGAVKTGKNDKFLRLFWEVDNESIGIGLRWRLHPKGGSYRKWAGNVSWIVDWSESAREHYRTDRVATMIPEEVWDVSGICWTEVTSSRPSFRILREEEIANNKALWIIPDSCERLYFLLAYLNTDMSQRILTVLCPSLDYLVGEIQRVPLPQSVLAVESKLTALAKRAVSICSLDWDSDETSPRFTVFPLLANGPTEEKLEDLFYNWNEQRHSSRKELAEIETQVNEIVADSIGVRGEYGRPVEESDVAISLPDQAADAKKLVSYAIGCLFGRFSMQRPGFVCASSSGCNPSDAVYGNVSVDEDGIIPVTDFEWFTDDGARRVETFVEIAFGESNVIENVNFIAASVGQKRGEASLDTLRRYLSTEFFKDHLRTYKAAKNPPRPIYWLFSSGKQRGFQALVYLHRYNEGTLARMRTEYVIPLLGKMTARIDHLTDDIAAASSSQHRKRMEKEKDTVVKQLAEVQKFDEKLRHYADQRIRLDLDDGVKVNYGKFGDLLAEVKTVTGKKP